MIILVELFHKGEAIDFFFTIFFIIQLSNQYHYFYGQIPGVIALKNPEKRLHHWLETSIMISGITQNKTRKNKAMRVTTIHGGRFFILSEITFFAPFSLKFEIDTSRFGSPVSFSSIDFIFSPK